MVVDSVEVNQEDIPASSVKGIAVNRNPFSAEFGRPARAGWKSAPKKGYTGGIVAP